MSGTSTDRHELDEARVAHQRRESSAPVLLHLLGVERLEGPVLRLLEEDQDRHEFARVTSVRVAADAFLPPAVRAATAAQTAARTRPPSRTGRVYSRRYLPPAMTRLGKPHHSWSEVSSLSRTDVITSNSYLRLCTVTPVLTPALADNHEHVRTNGRYAGRILRAARTLHVPRRRLEKESSTPDVTRICR